MDLQSRWNYEHLKLYIEYGFMYYITVGKYFIGIMDIDKPKSYQFEAHGDVHISSSTYGIPGIS